MKNFIYIIIALSAFSCSDSKSNKIKKQNMAGDFIYRKSDEHRYTPPPPQKRPPPKYPWEEANKSA